MKERQFSSIILTKSYFNALCNMFSPIRIYINDTCVYDDDKDVGYTVSDFFKDMEYLAQKKYVPFVYDINVSICDLHHSTMCIEVGIERDENYERLPESQDFLLETLKYLKSWVE